MSSSLISMSCGFSRTAAAQATSTRLFLRRAHRGFSSTPAESPVRLAIWGCGGVAEAHLNAAHKFGVDVEVTALVDTNAARIPIMHSLNVASNAIAYDTIDAALAEADVDVVAIFLPHNQHEHAAVKMLRTGKHVFLEKPMAPSVAECERIMAAAAEQDDDQIFMLAENSSFWPEVTRAKELLAEGAIGELITARAHYYEALNAGGASVGNLTEAEWLGWRRLLAVSGGGIVMDGGQHWLRPLREFMGEVEEVMAVTQRPFDVIEGESLCHALLRFESGKIGSYEACVLSGKGRMAHSEEPFFRLTGQEGELIIAGTGLHGEGSLKLFTNEHPEGKEMMDSEQPLGYLDSFGPQIANLVAAVRDGAPLLRDARFAVGDIKLVEAIYRSAESKQWEKTN